jgi:hypothetical protein
MQSGKSIIERAIELAQSPSCLSVEDVRKKLKAEQYEAVDSHISGSSITKQLRGIIAARQSSSGIGPS